MITTTDDQQAARKTTSPAPSRQPLPQTAHARIVSMTKMRSKLIDLGNKLSPTFRHSRPYVEQPRSGLEKYIAPFSILRSKVICRMVT